MAPRTTRKQAVEEQAVEETKALVQAATIERADRNDEPVPDADRDQLARQATLSSPRQPSRTPLSAHKNRQKMARRRPL
jgi:hypothetical protein